jgi:hypothetical protein
MSDQTWPERLRNGEWTPADAEELADLIDEQEAEIERLTLELNQLRGQA